MRRLCPQAADPDDRRWHAEAIACPRCGPSIWIEDLEGRRLAAAGAPSIAAAAELLRRGEILGLQGVGGFQLLVDARREDAVQRLRARKRRPAQPLALMVRDLEGAAALLDLEGEAGAIARAALVGREGPIVLARRRSGPGSAAVAPSVAPDEARLGVMLATTPAHALLLEAFGGPVVATSGNVHERPIVITVDDARGALAGVAVALLVHNRPILRRCDDSVIQIAGGRPRVLRLGRGLAPARFALPGPTAPLLALGGHLAQAPVLATHGEAIAWPHVGDLDDADARAAMAASQADLCRFVGVDPQVVAVDAHPDYATTLWAREREREGSPRRIMPVHHHHAHVAAVLAEHGRESALGVAWDGVGMGEDRGAWGGEFLAVDPTGSRRLAWVWPYPLPGGDAAARDGLRPLAGLLVAAGLPTPADVDGDLPRLCELAARSRLAPTTSSVGRLFDAIACLVGLRRRSEYQAQAARALEHAAADHGPAPAYPFALDGPRLDWRPMLAAAIADRGRPGLVAARLHATLVAMIVAVVERHRSPVVALAGGCFANTILLEGAIAALEARGIEVLAPARAPPGDGGLALGQAWVASHRLRAEARSNADAEET
ncbi:MAG: Sua5/YciO/YrdC/YwlC family protein [Nannocystaceae bacterium]